MSRSDTINNAIVKKLCVACSVHNDDFGPFMRRGNYQPTASELRGYRVSEGHRHFLPMPDEALDAFLAGLLGSTESALIGFIVDALLFSPKDREERPDVLAALDELVQLIRGPGFVYADF